VIKIESFNEILIKDYAIIKIILYPAGTTDVKIILYFAAAARNYAIIEANRKRPCLTPRAA